MLKYVVFDFCGQEKIALADRVISHDQMIPHIPKALIVSAGFCTINPPSCYGESTTLNLKSRPEKDTLVLMQYLKSLVPTLEHKTVHNIYV
jgi:hypothetical protein